MPGSASISRTLSKASRRIKRAAGRSRPAVPKADMRPTPTLPDYGPVPRAEVIPAFLAAKSVLEIGPFDNPMMTGPNVKYFDVIDQDAMIQRQAEHPLHVGTPPHIDFVSPNGDLAVVDERFDVVASSHCIEHQPDLVEHLQGVGNVLNPDGYFFLAVPDKRFCFDHFCPETSIAEVLDAHQEQRKVHSLANVVKSLALSTHNDAVRHWGGDHADPTYAQQIPDRIRLAQQAYNDSNGEYIDVHGWYFTPQSFRDIMTTLHQLDLSPLRVVNVYDTPHANLEFMAVLQLASR